MLRASARAGGSFGHSGESVTGVRIRERPARAPQRFVTVRRGSRTDQRVLQRQPGDGPARVAGLALAAGVQGPGQVQQARLPVLGEVGARLGLVQEALGDGRGVIDA